MRIIEAKFLTSGEGINEHRKGRIEKELWSIDSLDLFLKIDI